MCSSDLVSAPLADDNGKALRPSSVYYKLKKLFGEAPKATGEDLLSHVYRPLPTFGYVGFMLREYIEGRVEPGEWMDLVNWYHRQEKWEGRLKRLGEDLFYTNQQHYLEPDTAKMLYGDVLKTSISRLESFRQCACCYFLKYGIKAEERMILNFDRAKIGTLFHAALEQYPKELQLMQTTWVEASPAEMKQGVARATTFAIDKMAVSQKETARFKFTTEQVSRMTTRAVRALTTHLKNGNFEPVGYEINFGEGKGFPPIKMALEDGKEILVTGQIDRVDVFYKEEGSQYVKILDYKSGQKNFDLLEVYYGLQLQLLLYLDAYLEKHPDYEVGGVFYFHINSPYVSYETGMDDEQIELASLKQFKLSGLALADKEVLKALDKSDKGLTIKGQFSKDHGIRKDSPVATKEQFGMLEDYIVHTIKDLGTDILSGKVSTKPYQLKGKTPCSYCIYHTICQFDEGLRDNCYEQLEPMGKEAIWEQIAKEEK